MADEFINIKNIAEADISLTDWLVKADVNGLTRKASVQSLINISSVSGDVAFKGSLLIADTPVEGWYFAGESGTFINAGNIVADISNNICIIIVPSDPVNSEKIDIPITILKDTTVIEGSINLVEGGGVSVAISPFQKNAIVPNVLLKGIKSIKFYGADIDSQYTMAVFRKNISASGNLWDIRIYEWTGAAIGALLCRWVVNSYVPSSSIEKITLLEYNGSNLSADVIIDWSEIPDETDYQSQEYDEMGLALSSYSDFVQYADVEGTPNIWTFQNDVNSIIKASVLELDLYGKTKPVDYVMAVFKKKIVASDNLWNIAIYEWTGTTFGSKICEFSETNYITNADIEKIRLEEYSGSGVYCDIVIDWSKVPDGTSLTNQKYNSAGYTGINNYVYKYDLELYKFDILLPETVYFIEGVINRYWMYKEGFIENFSNFDKSIYNYTLSSDNANLTYSDELIKVINGANLTLTHEINVMDFAKNDNSQRNILSKTTNFLKKPALTGINMNTLVIADSYIDTQWGDGILEYLKDNAVATGNTVTLKGTRTSYGNLAEARASWTASQYLNQYVPIASREPVNGDPTSANMCSPFVFSTDDTVGNKYFSFSEYLSTNSITNVDNIVFFLGMNGGDGTNINTMITNIKLALPSVNIYVCTVPSYQTAKTVDLVTKQSSREAQIKSYIDLFDNRQGEFIYLLPINAVFNRLYSYNNSESDVLQYPESMVLKEKYTTDNHPNSSGAQTIAQMIHNYITYINS
mgnify:CR=1 FL=1